MTGLPDIQPDRQGLLNLIRKRGSADRVHFIELFLDPEIQKAIASRFGLWEGIAADDPYAAEKRLLAVQRALGYDYVRVGVDKYEMPLHRSMAADTAALRRNAGRSYVDMETGPITNWEEFERYPWPERDRLTTRSLEWYEAHLPDDMCVIGSGGFAHFAEYLSWLMGYETLCYALYDQRDLVRAIADKLIELNAAVLEKMLDFNRVEAIWASDDMGFKTATLIAPDDLRAFVLSGHEKMAKIAHAAGRPYLLHSCGNLEEIMEDLIEGVRIDAKHSFEDIIMDVRDFSGKYGDRIAVLGGVDVDLLCRGSEEEIRARVRSILETCLAAGPYCLGTGNSVANYIPVENYLIMLDEGANFRV